ncbi:uncharacterized protein LOC134459242 [Engraulis encrasicolus]|uniref:uncharacterized protein LOC134459242 n=1 Tax=Engraulis encrasicolus TaxID=184585 RepID=UPI002FD44F53
MKRTRKRNHVEEPSTALEEIVQENVDMGNKGAPASKADVDDGSPASESDVEEDSASDVEEEVSEYEPVDTESSSSSEVSNKEGKNPFKTGKLSQEIHDETEETEPTEIRGPVVKRCTKRPAGGRSWDKKHYCVYCQKPNSKISRHLERKHMKELEVAKALSFPKRSRKRKVLLEELRNKGNYQHNVSVIQNGVGEIVTSRQPSITVPVSEYLPCQHCLGFFVRKEMWRHEQSCKLNEKMGGKKQKGRKRVQATSSCLVPLPNNDVGGIKEVIYKMRQDEVQLYIRNDPLILKFGDNLFVRHGHDQAQHVYIAQKMREMGRFMLCVKKHVPSIKTLEDLLHPARFNLIVEGVRQVGKFCNDTNKYQNPSIALKIGYSLKKIGEIALGEALILGDEILKNNAKNFLKVLKARWNTFVSSHALITLQQRKWNRADSIPLTEDVMSLQKHIDQVEEEAKRDLDIDDESATAWKTLCEALLAKIILFNRRREGEAAKMLLETYTNRNQAPVNADILSCLTKLEKHLISKLTRFEMRGKRGRKVPVLLTERMVSSLELLIQTRTNVGVPAENPYVFARLEAMTHIRGSDCLRKFAAECGAKHPEYLTSTRLRKHVATMCQVMNLKENEMDQVAKFLGHDIRVHREYYRLSENTLQLAKISKLLMGMEKGISTINGKSLEEIDFSIEDDSLDDYSSTPSASASSSDATRSFNSSVSSSHSSGLPSSISDASGSSPVAASTPRSSRSHRKPRSSAPRLPVPSSPSSSVDEPASSTCSDRPMSSCMSAHSPRNVPSSPSSSVDEPASATCSDRPTSSCMSAHSPRNGVEMPKTVQKKRPWTDDERSAVLSKLQKYIALRRVPGKAACDECLREHSVTLQSRTWKDIKNFVHNNIQSSSKKLPGMLTSSAKN